MVVRAFQELGLGAPRSPRANRISPSSGFRILRFRVEGLTKV